MRDVPHAHFMQFGLSLAALLLSLHSLAAQERSLSTSLQFDAASVKPVDPNVPHMVGVEVFSGGRVVISSLSLKTLITTAFHLSYWQVSGGEKWTETEAYDLEANPPDEVRSSITESETHTFRHGGRSSA